MLAKTIIEMKRDGGEIPAAELRGLVEGYVAGCVDDSQMAAFAMATLFRGMSTAETSALTEAMRRSGACLDWSDSPIPTADKHSTGGVGDKLSLVIQPLAAACAMAVPSLAGRGLGHTGGTIDKLESIPGYNAEVSLADFRRIVLDVGVSIAAQTAEIAPADRKLYALRDVTGTVPSIPLIVASILSKKLAEGAGTLVFDVKCGSGAFMRNTEAAHELADRLVATARDAGRRAEAIVTPMDEPLGYAVGNAIEVKEALEVLEGGDDPRSVEIRELSIRFAARMAALALAIPGEEAARLARSRLADGSALARFEAMVAAHGGSLASFRNLAAAQYAPGAGISICAPRDGRVGKVDAMKIADAAMALGAGRARAGDRIDPVAGVEIVAKRGAEVAAGAPLCRLFSSREIGQDARAAALAAFEFER